MSTSKTDVNFYENTDESSGKFPILKEKCFNSVFNDFVIFCIHISEHPINITNVPKNILLQSVGNLCIELFYCYSVMKISKVKITFAISQ